jgi:hypothetical protein
MHQLFCPGSNITLVGSLGMYVSFLCTLPSSSEVFLSWVETTDILVGAVGLSLFVGRNLLVSDGTITSQTVAAEQDVLDCDLGFFIVPL